MIKLQAVVFCGGQSSRMGSDKALLPSETGNWMQHSVSLLKFLSGKVLISVNDQQMETFTAFFPPDQLVPDNLELGIHGPVCGLLSIHEKFPEADLFVLACDLQQMDPAILEALATTYSNQPGFDAYLWTTHGEPEPLCGIYCSKGLRKVYDLLQAGQLERHSMKYLIAKLNCDLQPVPDHYAAAFKNFNSHADLNGQ
ncbi:molybdenum cofactor guanylyltransferase [Flavihumibacter fluvii]|uniref:molybdenum cofactor guanylyltransferase n=1 Tax=Flavihumibacter fluvii TaxID=2838157 RepID=UPI001BDF394A|nr:molybdenum cofactor guanylyltransferase [Flavihumibacter fluvii]ULQ52817.1 molybdenum cofactor guanylyltransferase [Flavihumibacter fluvii]